MEGYQSRKKMHTQTASSQKGRSTGITESPLTEDNDAWSSIQRAVTQSSHQSMTLDVLLSLQASYGNYFVQQLLSSTGMAQASDTGKSLEGSIQRMTIPQWGAMKDKISTGKKSALDQVKQITDVDTIGYILTYLVRRIEMGKGRKYDIKLAQEIAFYLVDTAALSSDEELSNRYHGVIKRAMALKVGTEPIVDTDQWDGSKEELNGFIKKHKAGKLKGYRGVRFWHEQFDDALKGMAVPLAPSSDKPASFDTSDIAWTPWSADLNVAGPAAIPQSSLDIEKLKKLLTKKKNPPVGVLLEYQVAPTDSIAFFNATEFQLKDVVFAKAHIIYMDTDLGIILKAYTGLTVRKMFGENL